MIAWLIEYKGAHPVPVYVPYDYRDTHGTYTCDAWTAKRFKTKAEAEAWMMNPVFIDGQTGQGLQCTAYLTPWLAVEHSFDIKCGQCGGDPGFVERGTQSWCDGCIPF